MDSPSVPSLDVRDIDVRLTPRAVKSCPRLVPPAPSHSVLEQMSLCNFPGGVPESEEGGEREGVMRTRKRSREDLDTQSVDLHFTEPHTKKPRRPLSRAPSIQSLANIVKDTPFQSAKRRIKVFNSSFSCKQQRETIPLFIFSFFFCVGIRHFFF
ncbi:hypothetical protein GBAR_LOCUS26527, partial [Geodia barretti]